MTLREYVRANCNVPNVLTIIRLLLVPVYIILFALGEKYSALSVFLLASFTDLLDGRIARKYNLITDFGKLMDPLADKIMVLTAMISMALGNARIQPVIPWAAVILLFLKEAVMVTGGVMLYRKNVVVYSMFIGKVAQCLFIASLVAVYFHDWFVQKCAGWFLPLDMVLLWMAVALSIIAMVIYVTRSVRMARRMGILK